jgi:hypothetical protein
MLLTRKAPLFSPKACCRTEPTSRSSSIRCPRPRGSIALSPRYAALRSGLLSISAITAPIQRAFMSQGHSAGGHLTASTMSLPAVRGGLAISGIYDLEPIRLNYLNDKLGLDEVEAERNSQPRAWDSVSQP